MRASVRPLATRHSPLATGHSPLVGEDEGRSALLVDGVVQSAAVEAAEQGYWGAMLPDVRPRSALLLGLGGGSVAQLLARRFGALEVVGVDDDPQVVGLARGELGLALPRLQVVVQDAFEYAAGCQERFDFVCVDLFRGGEMARGVLARPFLRRVRALLAPRGRAAFNLFAGRRTQQQVQRLSRVLRVVKQVQVGKNVVVHCRT